VCVLPCDALLNASYIDDCPFIIYCRVFRFQPQCYHTVICGQLLESCAAVRWFWRKVPSAKSLTAWGCKNLIYRSVCSASLSR
jgi:hypothetical protein